MLKQYYNLSMVPDGSAVEIPVSQYDAGSRALIFRLYQGPCEEGLEFEIPEDAVVTCDGTKPDGKVFTYLGDFTGNTVLFPLRQQMAMVAGTVRCQLTVRQEYTVLGSANFQLSVEEGAMGDDASLSESEMAAVAQMTQQAVESAQTVQSIASESQAQAQQAVARIEAATAAANESIDAAAARSEAAAEALDTLTAQGTALHQTLTADIQSAQAAQAGLASDTATAEETRTALSGVSETAAGQTAALTSLTERAQDCADALADWDLDSQELRTYMRDMELFLRYSNEEVVGLQVDYTTGACTRLMGATGKTAGEDFDRYSMYGGRRRCTVADDGTITSWYGDSDYTEDGSMGQVMVYQPKFYYMVAPLTMTAISTGTGYHIRKANYYVSTTPKSGFKLHPAFLDPDGNEVEYFLDSAYLGSFYDVSEGVYDRSNGTGTDFTASTGDQFSSVAGSTPASSRVSLGYNLTMSRLQTAARNRGGNWNLSRIQQTSAIQLLMLIEYAALDMQSVLGKGVTGNLTYQVDTGGTASLGNGSGMASGVNGAVSVAWRGQEDPWGNLFLHMLGLTIWGNAAQRGGVPYICTDFNYTETLPNSANFISAGFTVADNDGYIAAFGYGSPETDWLFLPSDITTSQDDKGFTGDYVWIYSNNSSYRPVRYGGHMRSDAKAGLFYFDLENLPGQYANTVGGRLQLVPSQSSESYAANLRSWQAQMAA